MFYPVSAMTTGRTLLLAGIAACCVAFSLNARLFYLDLSMGAGDVRKLVPDLFRSSRQEAATLSFDADAVHGALQREMAGDSARAEKLLLKAASDETGFLPRFALASFYYRQQDRDGFEKWSRAALEVSDDGAQAILAMAGQLGLPDSAVFRIVPDRPVTVSLALERAIASFSVNQVRGFSTQLLRAGSPQDAEPLLSACESLVWLGKTPDAVNAWNMSIRQRWVKSNLLAPEDGNSLTDASFSPEAPSRGFGWRSNSLDMRSSVHRANGLSVALSGEQPESVSIIAQYLPVQANRRYLTTIAYDVRHLTLPGVFWRVVDIKSRKEIAHSSDMVQGSKSTTIVFDVPADSQAVELALWATRRTGSSRPSGAFTVDKIELVRLVNQ